MSKNSPSKVIQHSCCVLLTATLLLMPFLFGGVHELSFLSFRIAIFLLIALLFIFEFPTISITLSPGRAQGKVFWALATLLFFLCIHALLFALIKTSHPVLGRSSLLFDPSATINFILEFASFLSLYVITLFWFDIDKSERSKSRAFTLYNMILFSALLVALTALSHWFYDTGKLFWTFSANYEAVSSRARWPFVNPNHLGIFLIIPLFLALSRISQSWSNLKATASKFNRRGNLLLSDLLTSVESQRQVRSLVLVLLLVLSIGLAIIASLSRNAVFASLFCLILFYIFPNNKLKKPIPVRLDESVETITTVEINSDQRLRKRSRRRHFKETRNETSGVDISNIFPYLNFFWKVLLVSATIFVFWFFLGEKGGELFRSRVEYALLYTQDDMRWQLYKDSLSLLYNNPILGIGIGNWAALYPQFMSEGLSGMEPGFLHSDLLQAVIEFGLLGAFLFLVVGVFVSRILLKRDRVEDPATTTQSIDSALNRFNGLNTRSMFFGFLAVVLSASFEFPFRIPAICGLFAISLALSINSKENNV